tara:strand:- start:25 stop:726 length:702 start_codon:yes stop_codon:yes gene_type:complete
LDLLEELRECVLRDVSDATSADEADYLWTDKQLLRYLNEGYFKYAERSGILEDAATPAVCQIQLEAGKTEYPLHESITRVTSATYNSMVLKLATIATEHNLPDESAHLTATQSIGYRGVTAFAPDYNVGVFHVIGTPTAEDDGKIVRLRVKRLPLVPITEDTLDDPLEMPEQYHLDIVEWAAFRALRNRDYDGENQAKASAHKTQFFASIEEAKQTHRERTFTGMQYGDSWRW